MKKNFVFLPAVIMGLFFLLSGMSFARADDVPGGSLDQQFLAAVTDGNTPLVRDLLLQGADIHARNSSGQSCLHLVRDPGLAALLLEQKADVAATDNEFGMTALFFQDSEIGALLIRYGAEIDPRSTGGNTPLIWYAYSGYLEGAKLLVQLGADITAKNNDGHSALDIAVKFGNRDFAEYLQNTKKDGVTSSV